MKKNQAKILLWLTAALWGSGFVAVEAALNKGWTPAALLATRGLISGTLLCLVALRYKYPWYKDKRLLIQSFGGGLVMWIGFTTQTYGQNYANVSVASILTGLYVLFTPFLATFFKRHELSLKLYFACILAFLAIVLTSYDSMQLNLGIGELLLIVCAVFYALHFLLVEDLAKYNVAFATSGLQLLVMGVLSLLLMVISKQSPPSQGWLEVLFLAIVCSGLAFSLQVYSQQSIPSPTASLILSFESVFGVLGGILIFKEPFNWRILSACTLMMLAIYLIEQPNKTEKPTKM